MCNSPQIPLFACDTEIYHVKVSFEIFIITRRYLSNAQVTFRFLEFSIH